MGTILPPHLVENANPRGDIQIGAQFASLVVAQEQKKPKWTMGVAWHQLIPRLGAPRSK